MVAGLAFLAVAISTVFTQATLVRWTQSRRPYQRAWTIALVMFTLASVAFALGSSTGWDPGVFRAFYLLGAILNVPWLALGTVYLLAPVRWGRRVETGLVFFTGMALGTMLSAPLHGTLPRDQLPVGKEHFDALPRILAAAGSGLGATVLLGGAVLSMIRYARRRSEPGAARMAAANALIALGTIVLSSGGLVQDRLGGLLSGGLTKEEAFAITLASGIAIIYGGFSIASGRSRPGAPGHGAAPSGSPLAAPDGDGDQPAPTPADGTGDMPVHAAASH